MVISCYDVIRQCERVRLNVKCVFCHEEKEQATIENLIYGHPQILSSPNCRFVCNQCRRHAMYCVVCLLPVRAMCSICEKCGHGGHEAHLVKWFEKHTECAMGCGCVCRSSGKPMADTMIDFQDEDYPAEILSASTSNANMSNSNLAVSTSANNLTKLSGKPSSREASYLDVYSIESNKFTEWNSNFYDFIDS